MINVLKRLTKFGQAALFAAVSIAALFAYFKWVYDPEMDRYERATRMHRAAQTKVSQMGAPRDTTRLQKTKAALEREVEATLKRLTDPSWKAPNDSASAVYSKIVQMAAANRLSVVTQKLGDTPVKQQGLEDLKWMNSTVKLRGSYTGLPNFLESLREADWAVMVQELSVKPSLEMGKVTVEVQLLF